MEYSQVILEMLERIKTLEGKVAALEAQIGTNDKRPRAQKDHDLDLVSAKYRALASYLLASDLDKVTLSYAEIESILGFPLPPTAYKFQKSYWANTMRHSYASAWLLVGYKARVEDAEHLVTFKRVKEDI